MLLNRDELLLLSRSGRVPPATRAGPRPRIPPPAALPGRDSPASPRSGRAVRGLSLAGVRRALHRSDRRGPVAPVGPARPRCPLTQGYADPASYLELEFAVGFVAEEEMSK
jgi:hypothetical protein